MITPTQNAKVLNTPMVVIIQQFFYNQSFSTPIKLSLVLTCCGVVAVSLTDVSMNVLGTIYAIGGVLAASLYQVP